jgi:hypothetical protein
VCGLPVSGYTFRACRGGFEKEGIRTRASSRFFPWPAGSFIALVIAQLGSKIKVFGTVPG